jgi:hypothetical protein
LAVAPDLKPGDHVRLVVPENPRLDGTLAQVEHLTEWGAHLLAPAAGSGRFRALFSEMVPAEQLGHQAGYDGEPCDRCGALTMRRSGACLVCDSCGATSGCS